MATKFNNTFINDAPAIGSSASSWGSNIFVVHEALAQNDSRWNDPWHLATSYNDQASEADNTNSIEVIVPSAGLSLELYFVLSKPANETPPDEDKIELGVFGKTPAQSNTTGLDRRWPGDLDSTNYSQPSDMWVPLQNMDRIDSSRVNPTAANISTEQQSFIEMSLMDVAAMEYDDGGTGPAAAWYMSKRASVYLAGCTSIIVGCKAGGSVDEGMVLGRFVG